MPQHPKADFHPSQNETDEIPRAEELLRVIVDEAADYAFIVLDRQGRIQRWNPGAELLFGYSANDILTRHFSILFTAEDVDAAMPESELQQATENGKALDRRWHVRRDGTRFFADGVTTALRNCRGEIIGFVKLARDVTALQAADEDRRRMLIREQQLNREKDDFFAAVSHELRTPLTAISGWLELVDRNRRDEETLRDGIAVMQQAVASLSKLVDDLLDAVRTRTGKMRVDAKPADLAAIVAEAIQAFRVAFEAKKLTVREVLEPLVVIGDPTRLNQVMWNLISNAIRHNVSGGAVDVSLRRDAAEAVIEVRDTGDGIDPALLPYIFEPFRQHASGRSGGLGLGLAIARSLIELHGGTIEAESEGAGRGATFRVRLPLPAS